MFLSIEEIDRLIKEDVPYIDLTSWLLGINEQLGSISYFSREEAVVCGTEEVKMIFDRLSIGTVQFISSGELVKPGDVLISGAGQGCSLNTAWKVGQNILEHCSGIATKTLSMVRIVKNINPNIAVLTTRKGFPGTKPLAVKAVMAGGAVPHRLGLSETVLIFKQHINYIGGFDALLGKMPELKTKSCGKRVVVECSLYEEAKRLCKAGVDGIQFDKVPAAIVKNIVARLKEDYPTVTFFAAGGINETNAAEYADTNIDGIVTTSLYSAKPVDIGVDIKTDSCN